MSQRVSVYPTLTCAAGELVIRADVRVGMAKGTAKERRSEYGDERYMPREETIKK